MKKNSKSFQFMGTLLVSGLLLVGCSNEETQDEVLFENQAVISATQLNYSDEADQMSDDIAEVIEDVYVSDEINSTAKGSYISDYLPDCVTITTVVTETSKEKTIDFGEGCELRNGNILSGILKMSYALDMEAVSKTIMVELENFSLNDVALEGSKSVVRVRSNENGNPQSTATRNYSATWPDGESASITGTRTREWIEGFGTGFWGDNVFEITGSGTYINKAGNTFSKEITTPLRREMSCRFIVSGVVDISRNDATASLDFGDGSCDAKGLLTAPDGSQEEVFLRRFWN
ncbi:hypothetical protein [Croceivirga thetidis]|uniref:Lipoprotein n=1 Tax=Croceivirga thetidis TaxID=2721623 RepID=A0ABX1GMT4_9FLAO|nr:hypothetical protein [Croceivirga thetidis]NKI30366.1 hypothetical protein [Croceivirga thetidis]